MLENFGQKIKDGAGNLFNDVTQKAGKGKLIFELTSKKKKLESERDSIYLEAGKAAIDQMKKVFSSERAKISELNSKIEEIQNQIDDAKKEFSKEEN